MSRWLERLLDFRLIEKDFDGTEILKRIYFSGSSSSNRETDMDEIRKDFSEFDSDEDAKRFLMGERQLPIPVPRK